MKAMDDPQNINFHFQLQCHDCQQALFLALGVLEKILTFQCPAQNINLLHPKVEGSEIDT